MRLNCVPRVRTRCQVLNLSKQHLSPSRRWQPARLIVVRPPKLIDRPRNHGLQDTAQLARFRSVMGEGTVKIGLAASWVSSLLRVSLRTLGRAHQETQEQRCHRANQTGTEFHQVLGC